VGPAAHLIREVAVTYVDVNGLATWHEVRGEGEPVVLLHGGVRRGLVLGGAGTGTGPGRVQDAPPGASGPRRHPGRGRSLTYDVMVDDTVAHLKAVVGGPAHLVGWSDGAVVALLVARRRPDLVDRLVLIGQYYNSSGKVTGGLTDELIAGGD